MECSSDIEVHMRGFGVDILNKFFFDLLNIVKCFVEKDEIELPAWVE